MQGGLWYCRGCGQLVAVLPVKGQCARAATAWRPAPSIYAPAYKQQTAASQITHTVRAAGRAHPDDTGWQNWRAGPPCIRHTREAGKSGRRLEGRLPEREEYTWIAGLHTEGQGGRLKAGKRVAEGCSALASAARAGCRCARSCRPGLTAYISPHRLSSCTMLTQS